MVNSLLLPAKPTTTILSLAAGRDCAEAAGDTIDDHSRVAETGIELRAWRQACQTGDAERSVLRKCNLVSHDHDVSIG